MGVRDQLLGWPETKPDEVRIDKATFHLVHGTGALP